MIFGSGPGRKSQLLVNAETGQVKSLASGLVRLPDLSGVCLRLSEMDTPKSIRPIPEVTIGIVLLMLPETLERAMRRRQHVVVHLLVIAAATALAVPFVLFRSTVAQQKATQAPDDDQAVYVGLVEDDRRQLAQLGSKDVGLVSNRTVTPAFARDVSGWKPVDHLIRTVRWTIAFDGKNLGELDSEPISEPQAHPNSLKGPLYIHSIDTPRSEERRVGKECRSRWSPYH